MLCQWDGAAAACYGMHAGLIGMSARAAGSMLTYAQ
jgi:hypothetical protein